MGSTKRNIIIDEPRSRLSKIAAMIPFLSFLDSSYGNPLQTISPSYGFGGEWKKRVFDHNIFHSPHLLGKRSDNKRDKRKARRQKRTRLILQRGYA